MTSHTELTLYHGTSDWAVESIREDGIDMNMGSAGDFHKEDQPSAFYTTQQKRCAELWALDQIQHSSGDKSKGKVMEFHLDIHGHGLKVFDFGTETSGPKYDLWKKVSDITCILVYRYIDGPSVCR